jgi:CheY-like chemotaxis protein
MLINDILDLSKIESGTVVVDVGELRLEDLRVIFERTFQHVAESKNVGFGVRLAPNLPKAMFTDSKRLQQVIKNLLSNAFKFTHAGQVTLTVEVAHAGWNPDHDELNHAGTVLAFSVTDTGIGIPADKQQIIFEAFQQADGSTSRKYGGTGLGLAISRELSRLLGGEIRLISNPGKGSTFTLFLPLNYSPTRPPRKPDGAGTAAEPAPLADGASVYGKKVNGTAASSPVLAPRDFALTETDPVPLIVNEAGDDRNNIHAGDRVLLIVENDLGFARVLLDAARDKGFKGLVTSLGAAALAMTREHKPDAITLDIHLPDIEGWRVLERLKNDVTTRHIPVCVISTDETRDQALTRGAFAFVAKPIQTKEAVDELIGRLQAYVGRANRSLLVVEPDPSRLERILDAVSAEDVEVTAVSDGKSALRAIRDGVDCLVLGPSVPDLTPAVLAQEVGRGAATANLPVIVYGDGTSFQDDGDDWKRLAESVTVRQVYSPERLIDQTAFFLHRRVANLPEVKRRMLEGLHQSDQVLPGRKVLVVDDDMRNIFALSTVLEEQEMRVVSADNGRAAIRLLEEQDDIDIVLMDIMMPDMDGMDTMREIRKIPKLKSVPIVAVTAKAMKGDREKCIEAGAWDYLSKPVDTEQLLAVLRAWLHR